jgi:hypothetical protein
MPFVPDKFLTHKGLAIFHAYKDEVSDNRLSYWYCTSGDALPNSVYEFDVRELPNYREGDEHETIICEAIDAGYLESETPPDQGEDDE